MSRNLRNAGYAMAALLGVMSLTLVLTRPNAMVQAQDEVRPVEKSRDIELSVFMRKKLEASNKILEGLCTEDMALVKEGANALRELSAAEKFRVSNDVMYRQFSTEFQSLTQELIKAAESGNQDRVALKWMDATMSCMDCHRFVRGLRVAEVPGDQK